MRCKQASTETQVPRFTYNTHYNVGDKRAVSGSLNWAAGQALVTCAVSTQGEQHREPCNLTPPRATPSLPQPPYLVAFTGHQRCSRPELNINMHSQALDLGSWSKYLAIRNYFVDLFSKSGQFHLHHNILKCALRFVSTASFMPQSFQFAVVIQLHWFTFPSYTPCKRK